MGLRRPALFQYWFLICSRAKHHGQILCSHHRFDCDRCPRFLSSCTPGLLPEDISTHGPLIDEQMSDTMAEAGISFLARRFCSPSSSGSSPNRGPGRQDQEVSRRSHGDGDCGIPAGWHGSLGAGCFRSQGLGERLFHAPAARTPCPFRCRPGSSRSISAIPGRMASSARFIPTWSMRPTRISLDSITTNDPDVER